MATRRQREERERRKVSAKGWADEKSSGSDNAYLDLPDGVKEYKFEKPGIYKLDVIPYVVGRGNPRADEGMVYFMRTIKIHRNLGLEGKSTYCCRLTFNPNKPCPVCRENKPPWELAEGETAVDLRPSERILMNVVDVTGGKPKNPEVCILNQPMGTEKRPFFGQILKNKMAAVEEYQDLAELDGGYTMVLTVEEDKVGGNKYMKITNIELVKRKHSYDDDMIDRAACLDELPVEKSAEELRKILHQEVDDDDAPRNGSPGAKGAASSRRASDEDEDDEGEVDGDPGEDEDPTAESLGLEKGDVVVYHSRECEIVKVSGDGTSLTLKDERGKVYSAVAPSDVAKPDSSDDNDEPEDDEEDEAPRARKGSAPYRRASDDDDEDEDEDDEDNDTFDEDEDEPEEEDEDDDPPPKARKQVGKRR